jgi:hypothetical protein
MPDGQSLYSKKMNDKAKQPKKDLKFPHRHSYLLRLWQTEGLQKLGWRASLEVPETGHRIGFASLEQLFAYLMDLSECQADEQDTEVKK